MTLKIDNRVRQSTRTGGTGTVDLDPVAAGDQSFANTIGNTHTCPYEIDDGAGNWEIGIGTVVTGTPDKLQRTTILKSSASNLAVDFSIGPKAVIVTIPAASYMWTTDAFSSGQVGVYDGEKFAAVGTSGSGSIARVNTPTFITPILGAATATSLVIGSGSIGSDLLRITGTTRATETIISTRQGHGPTATALLVSNALPTISWQNTIGGTDGKLWDFSAGGGGGGIFSGNMIDDGVLTATPWMSVTRSVMTATAINFAATAVSVTGTFSASGHVTLEGVTSTGASGTGNIAFTAGSTFTGTTGVAALDFGTTLGAQELLLYHSGNTKSGFGILSGGGGELRTFASAGAFLTWGSMSTGDGTTFSEVMRLTPGTTTLSVPTIAATAAIGLTNNQNASTAILAGNSNGGAGAAALMRANNGTSLLGIDMYGTGNSGYGAIGTGEGALYTTAAGVSIMADNGSGVIKFATGGSTERARIDSAGRLLVGVTATVGNEKMTVSITGAPATMMLRGDTATAETLQVWNAATSGNNRFEVFYTEGAATERGSISYNRGGGLVAFNTTSDRRFKNVYELYADSGAVIDSVPVYLGLMHGASLLRAMMIADELQKAVPFAVTGEAGAVDAKGKIIPQQVDNQSLTPIMWAEIQALRKRVNYLEQKTGFQFRMAA